MSFRQSLDPGLEKTMNDDPIVREVRQHRAEILQRYGNSLVKHHEDIQRTQSAFGQRLVTLPPKPVEKKHTD